MSSALQVTVETTTRKIRVSNTDVLRNGDSPSVELTFTTASTATRQDVGVPITLGIKADGSYTGSLLASCDTWTRGATDDDPYTGTLALTGEALNTALANSAALKAMLEVTWGDGPTTSQVAAVTVKNDLNRENDAPPVPSATFSERVEAVVSDDIEAASAAAAAAQASADAAQTTANTALATANAAAPAGHTHDDRYYTETEVDALIANVSSSDVAQTGRSQRFYKAIQAAVASPSGNYIGIATYGDSVCHRIAKQVLGALSARFGNAANLSPNLATSDPVTETQAGTVSYNYNAVAVAARDYSYLPNGAHVTLGNGGSVLWSAGANQFTGYRTVKAFYLTRPGDGSLLIELVNTVGGATIASSTVSTNGALGLQSVTFTTSSGTGFTTSSKLAVRVTSTGTSVAIGAVFLRDRGAFGLHLGLGGSTLTQNNTSNPTVLASLLSAFGITMLMSEAKEENPTVSYPLTFARLDAITSVDKCFIGSLPDSSGDAAQLVVVDQIRRLCDDYEFAFFDGFRHFGSYQRVVDLGWQGDGTHLDDNAYKSVAQRVIADLGLAEIIGGVEGRVIRSSSVGANQFIFSGRTTDAADQEYSDLIFLDRYSAGTASGGVSTPRLRMYNIRQLHFDAVGAAPFFAYSNSGTIVLQDAAGTGYARLVVGTLGVNNGIAQITLASGDTANTTFTLSCAGANKSLVMVRSGSFGWVVKSSAYIAVAADNIQADTTSAAFTITLPASAVAGDQILIHDAKGTFGTNNLTIARNGLNINGAAANFVASTNGQKLTCVYIDATYGWSIR